MFAIGKDFVLIREVSATRIDEVDAGQAVLSRDLLRAQMFFDGDGVVGAAFDRGIVADDDALAPCDAADPGDEPRGRCLAAV